MLVNPCPCGVNLRFGTKIIASLYLARAVVLLLLGIVLLILSITAIVVVTQTESDRTDGNSPTQIPPHVIPATILGIAGIGIFIVISVAGAFGLALAVLLWLGIVKRNVSFLKIWMYITAFLGGMSAVGLIREMIAGTSLVVVSYAAGLLFDAYAVWVVYAYVSELRRIRIVQLNTELSVKPAA